LHDLMVSALSDADPLVVVGAAWFLAEHRAARAVPALMATAHGHDDVRCREGAVAALGAIGDGRGLSAVIDALEDKPTVRRRATVALAGFDDPRAELALQRAARDRDWQVRQAADELRRVDSSADNASADEPAPDDSAPDDKPAGDPDVSRRR
jgi:HEAT repeat protein